jgi:hypothetical protein
LLSPGSPNNNPHQPLLKQLQQHKEMEEDSRETPLPSSLEIAHLQSDLSAN